jgi:hypothetical protein
VIADFERLHGFPGKYVIVTLHPDILAFQHCHFYFISNHVRVSDIFFINEFTFDKPHYTTHCYSSLPHVIPGVYWGRGIATPDWGYTLYLPHNFLSRVYSLPKIHIMNSVLYVLCMKTRFLN